MKKIKKKIKKEIMKKIKKKILVVNQEEIQEENPSSKSRRKS
jgi:hypothetical protein